jgi:hypothetical protein
MSENVIKHLSPDETGQLKRQLLQMSARVGIDGLLEALHQLADELGHGTGLANGLLTDSSWITISYTLEECHTKIRTLLDS